MLTDPRAQRAGRRGHSAARAGRGARRGDPARSGRDRLRSPFEALARLLDSAPLRHATLAGTGGTPLAAILSRHFYEETVGHGYEGLEADAFTAADVRVKEYAARAWLWYPGSPVGPRVGSGLDPVSGEQPAQPEPRTVEQLVQATGHGTAFAVHRGDQYIRHNDRG